MDYKVKLQNIIRSTNINGINDDSIGLVLTKMIQNSAKQQFLHIALNDKEADIILKKF